MKITYDPNKNQRNIEERSLSFELVGNFDWDTAYIWQDLRFDYGEICLNALGFIDERLYYLTFKPLNDGI
ncbi:MAG: BrnT family toxin [Lonepinella koalarum]|nr:BrnT family toxin [Lonepinella koalarum]